MIQKIASSDSAYNNFRYKSANCAGYVSIASCGVCIATGIKKVNFPHKLAIHKFTATIACISALWHIIAIKQLDKKFLNLFR